MENTSQNNTSNPHNTHNTNSSSSNIDPRPGGLTRPSTASSHSGQSRLLYDDEGLSGYSTNSIHQVLPEDMEDSDDEPKVEKRAGRRKIKIEYIEDKSRRHITFSKRKAGIMKKAYELSTLTGTQVLLLVASETGHVYTFATPKLQPLITKHEGKNLIQSCLNAPEPGLELPDPSRHLHYTESLHDNDDLAGQHLGQYAKMAQAQNTMQYAAAAHAASNGQYPTTSIPMNLLPNAQYQQYMAAYPYWTKDQSQDYEDKE